MALKKPTTRREEVEQLLKRSKATREIAASIKGFPLTKLQKERKKTMNDRADTLKAAAVRKEKERLEVEPRASKAASPGQKPKPRKAKKARSPGQKPKKRK